MREWAERQTVCIVGWPELDSELVKFHVVANMGLRLRKEGGSIVEVMDAYVQDRLYRDNFLTVFYPGEGLFRSNLPEDGTRSDSQWKHGICALRGSLFKSDFLHHTVLFTPRSLPKTGFVKRLYEEWLGPFTVERRGDPLSPTDYGTRSCFAPYTRYFNASRRTPKMPVLTPLHEKFVYPRPDYVEPDPPDFCRLDLLEEPKRPEGRVRYNHLFLKSDGTPVGVDLAVDDRHLVVLPPVDDMENLIVDIIKEMAERLPLIRGDLLRTRWESASVPTDPAMPSRSKRAAGRMQGNRVVLRHPICQISFKGRTVNVSVTKGIRIILTLMQQPARKFSVLDLNTPAQITEEWEELRNTRQPERADEDDTPSGKRHAGDKTHKDEILPADIAEKLRERRNEVERLMEVALSAGKADGDETFEEDVEKYKEEIAEINKHLHNAVKRTRDGMILRRRFVDQRERARTAVKKCIVKAIEGIRDKHEALASHMDTFITTGNECVYKPESDPHWTFTIGD